MAFKTNSLMVFLVISMFLLSGCEVYQTLYGNSATAPMGQVISPSENEVLVPEEAQPAEDAQAADQTPEEANQAETAPEVVPVKSDEKPFVVVVQETDLVNLVPKAEDPDKNTVLAYTLTSPISDKGEWQTTYSDAGEYTVTVTVSDGEAATSRDVLLIVNKKEESPTIDKSTPLDSSFTVYETQLIDFSVSVSDLNKHALSYQWKLYGI